MSYLTLTKNLKLQLTPGLVVSYDIQPRNGSGSILILTHLLTYLLAPDPHGAPGCENQFHPPLFDRFCNHRQTRKC